MKNIKNKKKYLIIGIVVLLVMISLGVTFAYFSADVTRVNNTNTVLKADSLTITFRGQNEVINCGNIVPGDKCIKTFDVENTSNIETYFNIYMEDVSNGFNSDLVYTLKEGNTEVITETPTPESNIGKTYIKTGITIAAHQTKSYTLTIDFKHTDADQNVNQGKQFTTTVGIDTTQVEGIVKVISGGKINASNITDGTSVTKTFKVKNLADTKKQYDITLSDLVNTYANGLQYSLTKNGVEVIARTNMPTTDTTILQNQKIDAGVTDTYVMTIYYDSSIAYEEGYKLLENESNVFSSEITLTTKRILAKCKRADVSTLHTETCNQSSSYCIGAGYENGETITYGNQTTTSGVLKSGDAFDCDLDGNGRYDSETERFYFVATSNNGQTQNADVAVLIWYTNFVTAKAPYYSSGGTPSNSAGPRLALSRLPSVEDWPNMSLASTTRNITYETGSVRKSGFVYSANGVDKAARLLTSQEVNDACYDGETSVRTTGGLNTCPYLFENTSFASGTGTSATWLENAYSSGGLSAMGLYENSRSISYSNTHISTNHCIRPVIEVAISDIDY